MRKCAFLDAYQQAAPQQRYLPALVPLPGTVKSSLRTVSIATVEAPERICRRAIRVGYTGKREMDLAIYRLKIKTLPNQPVMTLAGFFGLKEGLFHEYNV